MARTAIWGTGEPFIFNEMYYTYHPDFNDNEYSALLEELLWDLG